MADATIHDHAGPRAEAAAEAPRDSERYCSIASSAAARLSRVSLALAALWGAVYWALH